MNLQFMSAVREHIILPFYKIGVRPLLLRIFNSINRSCMRYAGGVGRPVFYDIDKTYPSLRILENNFDIILKELMSILPNKDQLPRYHDIDHYQNEISGNSKENWRVFMLDVVGKKTQESFKRCPRTVELISKIPYVNQAFFSILEPRKSVPAHEGPYCGYLRYHLGLIVPEDSPPFIRVKDEKYTWKKAEAVLFDDSWEHEVVNDSAEMRVVLLVDVLRPVPWMTHLLNLAWTRGVGYFYSKKVIFKLNDYKLPEIELTEAK